MNNGGDAFQSIVNVVELAKIANVVFDIWLRVSWFANVKDGY